MKKNHDPVFGLLAQRTPNADILTREEILAQWAPVFVPVCYDDRLCLCGHRLRWGYTLKPRFKTGEHFGILGKECLQRLYPEITQDHLTLGRFLYPLAHGGTASIRKKDGCTDDALELAVSLGMISCADADTLKNMRSFRIVPKALIEDYHNVVRKILLWILAYRWA